MAAVYPPRVLVIEDDPNVRDVIGALLAAFGFDCQAAHDNQSGLVRFEEGGWDLVLTDLTMREVSGWEVVEAIRERAPSIPIVVLTGLSSPSVLRRAHECRVTVIAKPFQVRTLKAALVEALYAQLA
jgi:CheY-like chemotaxis protein